MPPMCTIPQADAVGRLAKRADLAQGHDMPPPGCRLPCLGQLGGVCPVAVPAALFAGTQIMTTRCAPRGRVHARQARNLGAPRGALLYRPRSGQGLEEVSLDLMANP